MKKHLLTSALFLLGLYLHAQTPTKAPANAAPTAPAATKTEAAAKVDGGGNPGSSIGFNLSSDGVGLQFAQNIIGNKKLAIRVGAMYLPYKLTNFEYDFDGTVLVINGDVKLGAMQALLDYHPFGNAFKLTGGLAYMLTDISAVAVVKDSVKQGDITLSPDEIGKIDVGIKVGPLCPYVGIGFGRAVPKSRFGFNFELGAYYITQPKVSFKATGMLEPSSSNEKVIQDNVSGYKWLPLMNFGFNFRISK